MNVISTIIKLDHPSILLIFLIMLAFINITAFFNAIKKLYFSAKINDIYYR